MNVRDKIHKKCLICMISDHNQKHYLNVVDIYVESL